MVPGSGAHMQSAALSSVLGPLLRGISFALCAMLGIGLFVSMMSGAVVPVGVWVVAGLPGIAGLYLLTGRALSLGGLRSLEIVVFGAAFVAIAVVLSANLAEVGRGDMPALVATGALATSLLILVYGVMIPNTWSRAALVVVPMALMPFAVAIVQGSRLATDDSVGAAVSAIVPWGVLLLLLAAAALAVAAAFTMRQIQSGAIDAYTMGLYNLKRKIGFGGMGEVWLAEHRSLARPSAIKLIRQELLGDHQNGTRVLQRFEREAQTTASLRSPHTIDIYDFGVTQNGIFYYVMEYLQGWDMETLVENHGPLPAARVIHLLKQACASLSEAHSQGLIHRDIKPANIYVCRMGLESDYVKVLDFGLVTNDVRDEASLKLTLEGTTTGTPAYMAPEMAVSPEQVDPRTDIYALGCVGYWLLTGTLVFEADTPIGVMVEHASAKPPSPSERTELLIPESLDQVILRCLAKKPQDRYVSTAELADALAACEVDADWDSSRADAWWQLHQPDTAVMA